MQLIMGIGTAEEIALAEVKADEQMKRTKVEGYDADPEPAEPMVEVEVPGHRPRQHARRAPRPIRSSGPQEALERLQLVPLIARPLARNTVERFARDHDIWRVTTHGDGREQAGHDRGRRVRRGHDDGDVQRAAAKQIRAEAEGGDALSPEMRRFIEEAKAPGVTRCPIRDIEEKVDKCPVDFKTVTPEEAKAAVEQLMAPHGENERG